MKQVMIVFDIPEDETIDQSVVPKLSHCRIGPTGADMICSTPVKIIDDKDVIEDVMNIISGYNIEYHARYSKEELF